MTPNEKSRPSRRLFSRFGDPPLFLAYAASVIAANIAIWLASHSKQPLVDLTWRAAIPWVIFCGLANLLPIPAFGKISLSMSSPVNIAVAFLFPPWLAITVIFVGSISEWEVRGGTTPVHAIFNRSQLALATGISSAIFWAGGAPTTNLVLVLLGLLAYESNLLFVALAERTARGAPTITVLKRLLPPGFGASIGYLGQGGLGIVYALVYKALGAWAVAFMLLPLVISRQALKVSRDLEKAERERRMLADRLIDESERERIRIASDIHDGVLQELAALHLQADNLVTALKQGDADLVTSIAGKTKDGVGKAITDLRSAIANLRRASLEEGGLVPTIEKYVRAFRAETGIDAQVHPNGMSGTDIPQSVGLLVYECCQEAFTNVARHSGATRVRVELGLDGNTFQMKVIDNGNWTTHASGPGGLGLKLTQDKVALAGGGFFVQRAGEQTEAVLNLPLRTEQ